MLLRVVACRYVVVVCYFSFDRLVCVNECVCLSLFLVVCSCVLLFVVLCCVVMCCVTFVSLFVLVRCLLSLSFGVVWCCLVLVGGA